jgi:formate dehydrogenase
MMMSLPRRTSERSREVAKVLCLLYDDPAEGHPVTHPRDEIPRIQLYPDGQTTPSPATLDFTPGELLGDLSGALGLRKFLAARGHTLVLIPHQAGHRTSLETEFDQALRDADILIIQACWPARLTAEQLAGAPRLRLVITAGTGSDHIDLAAAARHGITVAEITQSDSVSAAEYAVLLVLSLVHNTGAALPAGISLHRTMAERAARAYDLEGMHVGSVGAGRTGFAFLRRMRPFDVHLHYTDPRRLPLLVENELGLTYHPNAAAMAPVCDVVTIHTPLHGGTARLFDAAMIGRMKRGAYLVNTSAAAICEPDAVAQALQSGRLAGYATDTDYPPLASGTAAHVAGATLSAQARYASGTREVLECWFDGTPIRPDYLIVDRGNPTVTGARLYGLGRATRGAPS